MINIAINGFGRIGRAAFKIAFEKRDVNIIAINDLTSIENIAYMLKYDSVYLKYNKDVSVTKDGIRVGNKNIKVFSKPNPANLPWKKLRVDVVIESTGVFVTSDAARAHLKAGAKHVIISAPAKDDVTPTFVQGVNAKNFDKNMKVHVTSNASCTTNCMAPVVEIMQRRFGVEKAIASTVHSYTASQALVDGPSQKDFRKGRAAGLNIVPTSTGAAVATTKTVPELENNFDGVAIRVPTPAASLADMVFVTPEETTVDEVNQVLAEEAKTARYRKELDVTTDEIVSSDIIGSPFISVVDLNMTRVVGGTLVKVMSWYDNEWGYTTKLVEQAIDFGKQLKR